LSSHASTHSVTVRVGVAEEDFERAFFGGHFFEPRSTRRALRKPFKNLCELCALGGKFFPSQTLYFVEPRVAVHAVLGQAGPCGESAHIIPLWDGVTVRVGMAEEDFERAFFSSHFLNRETREGR
jgi:hypothetical protein